MTADRVLADAVAANVTALLEARGMSGRDLARTTGLARASVTRKLAGRSPFALGDLPPIAQALGVGLHELVPDSLPHMTQY